MFDIGMIYEIQVTAIIGEHRTVKPASLRPGQTDMPIVAVNRFYCSVDGDGSYLGEVINEILIVSDTRQAEYGSDGLFRVVQPERTEP